MADRCHGGSTWCETAGNHTEGCWAKSYDAEFLALARIEGAVVLTTDARMRRGADRTGLVTDPAEL
jgi:hypothetical protein